MQLLWHVMQTGMGNFCAKCQVLTAVFVRFVILYLRSKCGKLKHVQMGLLCPFDHAVHSANTYVRDPSPKT